MSQLLVGVISKTWHSIIKDACRLNLETIQFHINESEDLSDLVDTLRNILTEIGDPKAAPPQ